MIHKNEDAFLKDLRDSQRGLPFAGKLDGKLIPVELFIEEITLIGWALSTFKKEPLYEAINEAQERLAFRDSSISDIEAPFRKALERMKGYDMIMERLRGKLSDAVNAKLEQDGNQAEFTFPD